MEQREPTLEEIANAISQALSQVNAPLQQHQALQEGVKRLLAAATKEVPEKVDAELVD